ncbi:MAG: class I SAM-dependent methyltransferase [Burkholderiales bacterium]|nr:class I SAM-dependent methyltransferase [Burkholderiales bacterium]
MSALEALVQQKFDALSLSVAVVLPGGRRLGAADARLVLRVSDLGSLAHLATGQVGALAEDYVEGRVDLDGSLRDLMTSVVRLIGGDPTDQGRGTGWWLGLLQKGKSLARHSAETDARQVQFHYDVSDDFYALWLDPRRVYSCAYYPDGGMTLAAAQEAKLDLVCRKLMLKPGERFLDVGAGWGGLLLWAAEHYGVQATGITLSKNQHAHVNGLIEARGLGGRVRMQLLDYRALAQDQPFDKIASIGMFEHVGRAMLPTYFAKLRQLLKPGGLLMNHGITAGGTRNAELGAGIGRFIEHYIFPGGELLHLSHVLRQMADARLEALDVENLRPHYARTLWAWSDALEAQLGRARAVTSEKVVRAYRLYLAGCAMSFEQGWISLHQMLAARPTGDVEGSTLRGAQSVYPFQRGYIYNAKP